MLNKCAIITVLSIEPGNEMYGHYYCRICLYACMSVGEKKLNMIHSRDITGGSKPW